MTVANMVELPVVDSNHEKNGSHRNRTAATWTVSTPTETIQTSQSEIEGNLVDTGSSQMVSADSGTSDTNIALPAATWVWPVVVPCYISPTGHPGDNATLSLANLQWQVSPPQPTIPPTTTEVPGRRTAAAAHDDSRGRASPDLCEPLVIDLPENRGDCTEESVTVKHESDTRHAPL